MMTVLMCSHHSLCRRGRLRSSGWLGEGTSIPEVDNMDTESDPTLPSTEDVIRKTEQITKNIQELLRAAQENKHDRSESKVFKFKLRISSQASVSQHSSTFIIILFCSVTFASYDFSLLSSLSCPRFFFHSAVIAVAVVSPCLPLHPPTPHRPCEREGVRRLRHSLGCFSTLVPWAEKAHPPLQPLNLRSPDPTSWYSGFCLCLAGTVSNSFASLLLPPSLSYSWPLPLCSHNCCLLIQWKVRNV